MELVRTLEYWQWGLLALVPPAIIALYFLKLRRQPLEVPSTYLWRRTIEDLHVNSLWQRLRQNLLLLQLLLIGLIMLVLLKPGWRGEKLAGERFVFLIDTSASMNARDMEGKSRLERAKEVVLERIERLDESAVAMVLSFSDSARVEQPFTNNKRELRQKVAAIAPTSRRSDLSEALRAASGLANPGSTSTEAGDPAAARALPATLYLFSDGGFAAVPDFNIGNLQPVYERMGSEEPENLAITAFSVDRNPDKPEEVQAYGRIDNFGPIEADVTVSLYIDGTLADASRLTIPAREGRGVNFTLAAVEQAVLKLQLEGEGGGLLEDVLPADNTAFVTINPPRKARVLLVTPGNEALRLALSTEDTLKIAEVSVNPPDVLTTKAYTSQADSGGFDLVIFDRCAPERMPLASTLFIGRLPPGDQWTAGEEMAAPVVIDTQRSHPLMQLIELARVVIFRGFAVNGPAGSQVLIDADIGPLLAIAPRGAYEDAVMGFELVGTDDDGSPEFNTDWVSRLSFPLFGRNLVEYLGGARGRLQSASFHPGEPMVIRTSAAVESVRVEPPEGPAVEIARGDQNAFLHTETARLGVYSVYEGKSTKVSQQLAVNLLAARRHRPRETRGRARQRARPLRGLEMAPPRRPRPAAHRVVHLQQACLLLRRGLRPGAWGLRKRGVMLVRGGFKVWHGPSPCCLL